MKKKVVSLVLVISLLGAVGFGCYPKEGISEIEKQIAGLEAQIADLEEEIAGHEADKEAVYQKGVEDTEERLAPEIEQLEAELYSLRDPSFDELISFIRSDHTDRETHESHSTYTYGFLKKAKEAGIQGYPAVVRLTRRHLIIAVFKTTDTGDEWTFVVPATDQVVKLSERRIYSQLNESNPFGFAGDDLIKEIMIYDF